MITGKYTKINKTSPLTKLRNPANKLLHHQSKQAIYQHHKTNLFSKLIKTMYFSLSSSNDNINNEVLMLYLSRK